MHIQNKDLINGQIPKNLIDQLIETNDITLILSGCTSLTALPALPAGLKNLNLNGCTSLTELPALPAGLRNLDLGGCALLTALPALPASLTKLNLNGCTSLTALPALPAGLQILDLSGCTSLTALPDLPAGLKFLHLNDCTSLTALPDLPAYLEYLYLNDCTSLTALPVLPAGLRNLDLGGCALLTALPALPAGLKTLDVGRCTSLTTLPALPAGLQYLYLSGYTSLTALPALPAGLEHLNLGGCTSLTALPALPAYLETLDVGRCRSLTALPALPAYLEILNLSCTSLTALPALPDSLTELSLEGCTSLRALPALPAGLNFLDLSGCRSLTALPALPADLETLGVGRCTSLTKLPALPDSLETLDLSGCTSLTALPDLPAGLKTLDLRGCTSLVASADLLQNLQSLNSKGCNIEWPDHLRIDAAKIRLTSIIKRYKRTNPAGAESTARLFSRFCTEGLGQRDGADAVAASVNPFLDLLEREPNHLTWINKIAGIYLDGCVNQPVAGFAEISAWVSVAQKPEIAAKIAAAHQLMALDTLKEFVANSNPKPGARVEVEAGNALLREVHKILVSSQMEPWPGVPGSISYEGTIKNWLTEENIIAATGKVAEVMAAPTEKVTEYLLERYTETWATVAFPREHSEILEKYAAKRDALARLLNPELYEPESKDSSPSPLCQNALTEFNKVLAAIPQQQHPEKIAELSKNLERAEQEEIASSARALTEAAVRQPAARTAEQKEREEKEPRWEQIVGRNGPRSNDAGTHYFKR